MKYAIKTTCDMSINRKKGTHNHNNGEESTSDFAFRCFIEAAITTGVAALIGGGIKYFFSEKKAEKTYQRDKEEEAEKAKHRMEQIDKVHQNKMEEMRYQQEIWKERQDARKAEEKGKDSPNSAEACKPTSFTDLFNDKLYGTAEWLIPGIVRKGQTCALVAGSDVGKSIAMMDFAITISNGLNPAMVSSIEGYMPKSMKTLLYCLEPRPGELQERYKNGKVLERVDFIFSQQLQDKGVFNLDGVLADFEKNAELFTEDTFVLFDPITKLNDYDTAKFISKVTCIKEKAARRGVIITVLFSAHTDEKADWKPLTQEDIKGGDKLIQQVDSVVALRKARTSSHHRFFQTLKVPKGFTERDTVPVIRFTTEGGFTHFVYVEDKKIKDVLPLKPKADANDTCVQSAKEVEKAKLVEAVKKLWGEGKKPAQIAKELGKGKNITTISRVLDEEGLRKIEQRGKNKKVKK